MSDRKYKQRGYMESERSSGSSSGPRPPLKERLEGSPRGRTAGGFGPEVFRCARCGKLQQAFGEVATDSLCECGADLHTCTNCKFFDTSARWECRADIPARVAPKDARNECELFTPRIVKDLTADKGSGGRPQTPDDARKAFEDLFKK